MTTIYGLILTSLFGWKIKGDFPDIKKSIIIFAPHTSYFDAVIGKLYLKEIGIKHRFLSKKELFHFPFNLMMNWYGSMPVGKNSDDIFQVSDLIGCSDEMHIVLSPEGTRKSVTEWKKGFYYMAKRANVPIVVGYIDYTRKEIGVLDILTTHENVADTLSYLYKIYKPENTKYHTELVSM